MPNKIWNIIKADGLLYVEGLPHWMRDGTNAILATHNDHGEAVVPRDVIPEEMEDIHRCLYDIHQCCEGMQTGDGIAYNGTVLFRVESFHVVNA